MFYYASRNDKNGDYLVTSYTSAANQKKYGGVTAKFHNGYNIVDIVTGKTRQADEKGDNLGEHEIIVRSYMQPKNPPSDEMSGNYEIFVKDNDNSWKPTKFKAASYGAANTLMKALSEMHSELMIVETGAIAEANSSVDAPF